MSQGFRISRVATTVLAAVLVLASIPASGQVVRTSAGAVLPRTADGKPDLSGIWQAPHGVGANLERRAASAGGPAGPGLVVGGGIPYQPWALKQRQENFRTRADADPFNKCFLPGVPRLMYVDYPFQIFQTPQMLAMAFGLSNYYRLVYTNGTAHPEGLDFWLGDSRGRWEGDTLVVDVRNHNDRTWFDAAGNFHSEALVVVERYRLVDADTLAYEATIEDSKVYTKPWTLRVRLRRQKALDRLPEHICQAEKEEAAGLFTREPTWYPAKGQAVPPVTPFTEARPAWQNLAPLPAPDPKAGPVRRRPDGRPDMQGQYSAALAGSRSSNYGLEPRAAAFMVLANKGYLVDPPDRRLPLQPWARELIATRGLPEHAYDDPAAHCFPAGTPRANNINEQQLVQTSDYVVFLFERMGFRIIALDGRRHLPEHVRVWQGDSVGRWEGDTLVVDTTNFNGRTWLNEPGGPGAGGEPVTYAEHVIERFTPVDGAKVHYEATVVDPVAYTKPWTMTYDMRQVQQELLEVACKEDDQDLPHLKAVKDAAEAARRNQK